MRPGHRWSAVLFCIPALAQQDASAPDAQLKQAIDAWQNQYQAWLDAMAAARQRGKLEKGALPPPEVQAAELAANRSRDQIVARFGKRADLTPASWLLLARMHEHSRDYVAATDAYEKGLGGPDAGPPDLRVLGDLCLAALNSKDDQRAGKWMQTLIDEEDRRDLGARRNLAVRTSYYPRVLIALEDWDGLDRLIGALAADDAPSCRAAAATFGVVLAIHQRELVAARQQLTAIRADVQKFSDLQAWAVLAQLALDVHDGRFDEGAAMVRAFLQADDGKDAAPMAQNQRRYLEAVAPFLGKPAVALRADHCLGGDLHGDDVLPTLRGRVVVLDFWQPWCEPCRKAMPEMVRAQTRGEGKVQVLGVCKVENYGYDVCQRQAVRPIAPQDYPAHIAHFRKDMGLDNPVVVCDTDANSKTWRIGGVPTLVLIDRQGVVRYMSCGAGEPGLFALALEGLLAAK
jgi:thiol-disulfide isomerase/thioredoxin